MLTWWPIINKYGLLRTMKQKQRWRCGRWVISWRGLGYGSAGSAFKTFTVLRDILVLKSRGIPLQGKEGRVLSMSVLQESPISLSLLREGGIKRLGNNTVHFSLSQSRVREKNSWWHVPKWSRHKWKQEDRSTGLPGQAESPETLSLMPGPYYETVPRRSPGREDWKKAKWIYEHIVTIRVVQKLP